MVIKKICGIVILFCVIVSSNIYVFGEPVPIQVDARSAVLMEPTTGKVLLETNKDDQLPLASVTKIMTMLLIYEAIDQEQIKWEDKVTVSEHAAGMGGSQVYLEAMEQQTVRELVKCISIASANDASVAMAEYIAGSEDGFVTMMNQKAKDLGMNNTNFVNACGLDADNHYSSAYDIALMTQELIIKYPEVFEFTTIWQDEITHTTARGSQIFGLTNTNKLIKSYEGATGLKTGSTSDALFCLSGTATRDDVELIAVILGAPNPNTRFHEVIKMLDYGFANYTVAQGIDEGEKVGEIIVHKGETEKLEVVVKDTVNLVVGKGSKRVLENKVELIEYINAPVTVGSKVGEVIYTFEGKEVGRCDVVAGQAIEKAGLQTIMTRLVKNWFS